MNDVAGKNCVITGATSGIGRMTAAALAESKANLFLIGRNERAGQAIVTRLRRHSPGRIEFIRTDLSQQDEVRALASRIAATADHVDVLVNNAGARNDEYQAASDGVELTFAANHLGHFLLTRLLMDRLTRAPAARVVTVASGAHLGTDCRGVWYLDRSGYDRKLAYAKSKLANIMFAYELSRRLRGTRVTSNAVDPGLVATNFARNNGLVSWMKHLVSSALRRELISPREGAETLVYLSASEEVAGATGKYFRCKREVESSPASHDLDEARRLWELSSRLTRLDA